MPENYENINGKKQIRQVISSQIREKIQEPSDFTWVCRVKISKKIRPENRNFRNNDAERYIKQVSCDGCVILTIFKAMGRFLFWSMS